MSSEKEENKTVVFFRDNSKLIQFIFWVITAAGAFLAWYGERAKNNALGDYVTIEVLDDRLMELGKKLSERNDHVTDSILSNHRKDLTTSLSEYAQKYIQPMYQTDDEIKTLALNNKAALMQIASGQGSLSADLREQIKKYSIKDSLERENARLRSQIKTQETIDDLFNKFQNSNIPRKINKDRIQ